MRRGTGRIEVLQQVQAATIQVCTYCVKQKIIIIYDNEMMMVFSTKYTKLYWIIGILYNMKVIVIVYVYLYLQS